MGKDVDDAVRRFAADAQIAGDDDDEEFDPTPTRKKGKVRPFVDWPSFNGFIGLLIVVNALCIGLETDAKSEPAALWFTLELAFVAIFLTELVLRLRAHRWNFFTTIDFHTMSTWSQVFSYLNFWNLLDFIIVSMSILDAAFLPLLGMAGANLRFLQMIRFFPSGTSHSSDQTLQNLQRVVAGRKRPDRVLEDLVLGLLFGLLVVLHRRYLRVLQHRQR